MEETTFPAHVNSYSERTIHRSNRRIALFDYLYQIDQEFAKLFWKAFRHRRRDLSKPRKIK